MLENSKGFEGYALVTQHLVMNEHLNPNNVIFGGALLAWLDTDVYIHVTNKMRYKSLVTGSLRHVHFKSPAYLGDTVQIYAKVKEVRRSSVTGLGKAVAYYADDGRHRLIIECEIRYVAVDKNGKPIRAFQDAEQGSFEERRGADSRP